MTPPSRLRIERLLRGFTLYRMEGETGIHEARLSRIERGERPARQDEAMALGRVFDLGVEDLFEKADGGYVPVGGGR